MQPNLVHRSYDVHGLRLDVVAASVLLSRAVNDLLGGFRCRGDDSGSWTFALGHHSEMPDEATPDGMRLFWAGSLPGGIHLSQYVGSRSQILRLRGLAEAVLSVPDRAIRLTVLPGGEECLGEACIVPILCQLLSRVGHHVVHAACLSDVREASPRAVLVSGPSGTGKTTTSLALSRGGFQLLTDDATFIDATTPGRFLAWGLPRPLKVHARTLELLPWLMAKPRRPARTENEFTVEPGDMLAGPNSSAEPALILLLEPRNTISHRFCHVDAVSALARLARENVRATDPNAAGPAGKAFAVIATLVRQCEVFALSVGPDLDSLAGEIADRLGG